MRRWTAGALALGAGILTAVAAHFLISILFGAIAGLLFATGTIPNGEAFRLIAFAIGGISLVSGIALGSWVAWKVFRRAPRHKAAWTSPLLRA